MINYRETPAWGDAARAAAGGEGIDHVVEVGGQGTFDQSLRAVRLGGTISLIGVLAGAAPVNLTPVLMRNIRVQGVMVGSTEMFHRMNVAISHHALRPVVDRVFPFDGGARGVRVPRQRGARGEGRDPRELTLVGRSLSVFGYQFSRAKAMRRRRISRGSDGLRTGRQN